MIRKVLLVTGVLGIAFASILMSANITLAQRNPSRINVSEDQYSIYLPLTTHSLIGNLPSWNVISAPTASNLTSISMLQDNTGYIVGELGTILQWDGVSWETATSPTSNNLTSVSLGDLQNGWSVSGLLILKWNGSDWNPVIGAPALPFQGVSAVGNKAWMVGGFMLCTPTCNDLNGVISHWDGSAWNPTVFSSHKYLNAIDMLSDMDGFAVGDIIDPGNPLPAIIRWNGSTWENQTHPAVLSLSDISAFDSNHAWAVGRDTTFTCTLLNWNGSTWSAYSCPSGVDHLAAISMVAADDVWAVGGTNLVHWDGNSWTKADVIAPADLNDIEMRSAIEGWAVGDSGTILHFSP